MFSCQRVGIWCIIVIYQKNKVLVDFRDDLSKPESCKSMVNGHVMYWGGVNRGVWWVYICAYVGKLVFGNYGELLTW